MPSSWSQPANDSDSSSSATTSPDGGLKPSMLIVMSTTRD